MSSQATLAISATNDAAAAQTNAISMPSMLRRLASMVALLDRHPWAGRHQPFRQLGGGLFLPRLPQQYLTLLTWRKLSSPVAELLGFSGQALFKRKNMFDPVPSLHGSSLQG